ncbi:MAG: sulfite reductase, ferredoxin dependent [Brasilonema octagenarum HA4186-MV1]|jgi:sulfite reductase (ferredoxin)|uniref:assimilatory sulfite reductase (ferredoxin) n=1 Tax=Brasilonema octagenarum UFV-OR1 TaxID=417115 RepID=A0ABX1M6U0_9CYAN|nr:sulfite reductase, ferredoxin dependent [Brasilonema octagenarum]MBW4625691.1 sulfite reductase, ferredoxin dependent [Brasilonema octagenarum HA4186-MV1]NMF61752.1 sulfite reductase, ferredoxin dependent [Brasilonema octagenarum UFV-OR1]
MVKSAPPTTSRKPSKVEAIKERSNSLREPVATEILQDTTHFSEDAIQILKFHGSYQQDNRDNRVKGQEKDYQFMLRTRNPGGFVPPQLFLTLDKLADEYGSNTLRVTTRQGFQMHGILKKNLKAAFAAIIKNMGSTLGACGDVNRNVMAPPAPFKNKPEYQYAWEYADNIASLLTPQTGAYYEIWLDGEMAISAEENPEVKAAREKNGTGTIFHDKEEPLYGTYYMPRKFKACVTVPGDNSIDLYSQDLTLVVITNDKEELEGFDVFAGGGLGRTHNKEETFARVADPICYVDKNDVYDLVKAIVATQRDYGDRTDRRHARLKYLIHDWGVDKFRSQVEEYFGKSLAPFKKLPEFKYHDFLGWNEQGDGKLFLGISIDNGRIKDEGDFQLKTALREIVEKYNLPIRLTPHQNLVLYDIEPKNKQAIQKILSSHGVIFEPEKIDSLVRYAMACPALPTCGLAITESERAIPGILERIRALLDKTGLPNEHFVVRMTGCPNGCARPYMAELGFVGSAPESYQVWLGGSPNQTRLALPYMERLHDNDIETQLEPIFVYFKQQRQTEETFGDFCDRMGFDAIREFAANYESQTVASPEITDDGDGLVEAMADSTTAPITEESDRQEVAIANTTTATSKNRHRVTLQDEVYDRLKEISQRQGKAMTNLVNEALLDYLKNL